MEHPLQPGTDARHTARPPWSRAAHPTIPELAARAMALETAVARLALAAQAPDADPASVLAACAAALEAEGLFDAPQECFRRRGGSSVVFDFGEIALAAQRHVGELLECEAELLAA